MSFLSKAFVALIIVSPIEHVLNIESYVYSIIIVLLGIAVLHKGSIRINESFSLILFLLYAWLSCLWSISPNAFSSLFITTVMFILLFLMLQFKYSHNETLWFERAFFIQGFITLILSLRYGSIADGRLWIETSSSGADPNYLSGWTLLPIAMCLKYIITTNNKALKLLSVIELGGLLYLITITGSRSGLICATVTIFLSLVFWFKQNVKRHIIASIAIMIVFLLALYIAFQHLPSIMISRLSIQNDYLGGRSNVWVELLDALISKPVNLVFGFGQDSVVFLNSRHIFAHNTYLDILVQQGIIGLTIYGYFVISTIKTCMRKDKFLLAAFIGVQLLIMTLSAVYMRFLIFALFMAGHKERSLENS